MQLVTCVNQAATPPHETSLRRRVLHLSILKA